MKSVAMKSIFGSLLKFVSGSVFKKASPLDRWDSCEQKTNTQQVSILEQLVSPAVCFFSPSVRVCVNLSASCY